MDRERKHDAHMPQYSPENLNLSDKKYKDNLTTLKFIISGLLLLHVLNKLVSALYGTNKDHKP